MQADWRQFVPVTAGRTSKVLAWINARMRPTMTQTRFMAYNAIIHGARGLAYWGTSYVPRNAALWRDLKALAGEMRTLLPALVQPPSLRTVSRTSPSTPTPPVETLLLKNGANHYLIAANTSARSSTNVTLTVSGLHFSSVSCLFETSCVKSPLSTGVVADFAPYEAHVFLLR